MAESKSATKVAENTAPTAKATEMFHSLVAIALPPRVCVLRCWSLPGMVMSGFDFDTPHVPMHWKQKRCFKCKTQIWQNPKAALPPPPGALQHHLTLNWACRQCWAKVAREVADRSTRAEGTPLHTQFGRCVFDILRCVPSQVAVSRTVKGWSRVLDKIPRSEFHSIVTTSTTQSCTLRCWSLMQANGRKTSF